MGTKYWVKWFQKWARYSGWRWWWISPWRGFMKSLWNVWRQWESGTQMSRRSRWGESGMGGRDPQEPSLRGGLKLWVVPCPRNWLNSNSGFLWSGRSCRRLEKTQWSPMSWLQIQQEASWGPVTSWVYAVLSAEAPPVCWLAWPHTSGKCLNRKVSSGNTGSRLNSSSS